MHGDGVSKEFTLIGYNTLKWIMFYLSRRYVVTHCKKRRRKLSVVIGTSLRSFNSQWGRDVRGELETGHVCPRTTKSMSNSPPLGLSFSSVVTLHFTVDYTVSVVGVMRTKPMNIWIKHAHTWWCFFPVRMSGLSDGLIWCYDMVYVWRVPMVLFTGLRYWLGGRHAGYRNGQLLISSKPIIRRHLV